MGVESFPTRMSALPAGAKCCGSTKTNMAISRTQGLTIIVASGRLLEVPCRTIGQVKLVNAALLGSGICEGTRSARARGTRSRCVAAEQVPIPRERAVDAIARRLVCAEFR